MLSDGAMAGRYRARLLADIGQRVQMMTAVHFLWVHSHVGITPNEAADVRADAAADSSLVELPLLTPSPCIAWVQGCKSSLARHMTMHLTAELCKLLIESSTHSLYPGPGTWRPFACMRTRQGHLLSEHDLDVLQDARLDRLGLPQEQLYIPTGDLGRHSWCATLRYSPCPL